jgi:hypothetical protein
MKDSIAVYTFESKAKILRNGYTQEWTIGRNAKQSYGARGIKYVICTRSHHPDPEGAAENREGSRTAFLVGLISDIEQLPWNGEGDVRSRIYFDSYQEIDVPDFWIPGHQRPEFRQLSELTLGADDAPLLTRPLRDAGATEASDREGHSVHPTHAKIVDALEISLKRLGWRVAYGSSPSRPDLVVTKGEKCILLEVKPDDSPASFYCAIGQLLVYRRALDVDRSVIVAKDLPRSCREVIANILLDHSISFVHVLGPDTNAGSTYAFPELEGMLGQRF